MVVGAGALLYYGAKMAPMYWEFYVSEHLYGDATALFTNAPLNENYDPWPKSMPQPRSRVHTYPCFTLKRVHYFFWISTAFESRIDCDPEKCRKASWEFLTRSLRCSRRAFSRRSKSWL